MKSEEAKERRVSRSSGWLALGGRFTPLERLPIAFRTDGGAFEEVSERSLSADGKALILRPRRRPSIRAAPPRRTGVPFEVYRPRVFGHGFLFDPTSLEGARARRDAVDFLLAGNEEPMPKAARGRP